MQSISSDVKDKINGMDNLKMKVLMKTKAYRNLQKLEVPVYFDRCCIYSRLSIENFDIAASVLCNW